MSGLHFFIKLAVSSWDLLGGFQVSMDNFVEVEVVHATCNAHGPVNQEGGGDFTARPQHLVQLALSAVFH